MGASGKQASVDLPNQMQLGLWELWRSLPRPCKLFLVVSVVQAFVSGAFAAQQLAKVRSLASHLESGHASLEFSEASIPSRQP